VVGWAGVVDRRVVDDDGGPVVGGQCPDEGAYPSYNGPAQQEIEDEDPAGIALAAHNGNDGWKEIRHQQECADDPAEDAGEKEDVMVKHIIKIQKLRCDARGGGKEGQQPR